MCPECLFYVQVNKSNYSKHLTNMAEILKTKLGNIPNDVNDDETNSKENKHETKLIEKNKNGRSPKRKAELTDPYHDEYQYLNLVKRIIETGHVKGDRTGIFVL